MKPADKVKSRGKSMIPFALVKMKSSQRRLPQLIGRAIAGLAALYVISTLAAPAAGCTVAPSMQDPQKLPALSVNRCCTGESMADDLYLLAKNDGGHDAATAGAVAPSAFHNQLHNATILLMRHAEKPSDPTDTDLAPAGFARAKALADYIPQHFGRTPDYLFASTDSSSSSRPRETLTPLSQKTGVPIDTSVADKDYKDLAKELDDPKFDGKFIVIAWHHGKIPELAQKLGAPAGSYPSPWDGKVYDEIIEIDYGPTGNPTVKEITEDFKVPGRTGH
jgi:phosphohistidine phosphatase SixA